MIPTVLLCTVGGSHQPIVKAIESVRPQFTCFFCTDRDPESGKPGSVAQVTGQGKVIKACPTDDKPTLLNITAQANLDVEQFETRIVPADDLDGAFVVMRKAVTELARQHQGARFVADYTGGTKTMTAALVCAALQRDDVELRLVTGARADLGRVVEGTEQSVEASVSRLRLDRAMAPYLDAWRRFSYHEAADGLDAIRIAANAPDKAFLGLARSLSRALACWDDFDHAAALRLLDVYASRVGPAWPWMLPTLRLMVDEGNPLREPARLFDLWWNAVRRASQGRFDDAVARVYRLIEWTAQWQLRSRLHAETANFPRELLPSGVDARPDRDGRLKLGLWSAWQVVAERIDSPARNIVTGDSGNELRDLLAIRNNSILAHGFQPVQSAEWTRLQCWMQEQFLPTLESLATDSGLRKLPDQLPDTVPASIMETD